MYYEKEKWLRIITVIVKTVVTPRPTRAGDASLLSQNETHEMVTMSFKNMRFEKDLSAYRCRNYNIH
jgi:hypothetical protein